MIEVIFPLKDETFYSHSIKMVRERLKDLQMISV